MEEDNERPGTFSINVDVVHGIQRQVEAITPSEGYSSKRARFQSDVSETGCSNTTGRKRRLEVSAGQSLLRRGSSVQDLRAVDMCYAQLDEAALAQLAAIFASNPLFNTLTREEQEQLCANLLELGCESQQVVIRQGDVGDCLYIVASGVFAVSFDEEGTRDQGHLDLYTAGNCFGELALMYNCPRGATVTCTEGGLLWALDRATFREIVAASDREACDSRQTFLRSASLFGELPEKQLAAIGAVMEELTFADGDAIVLEGDEADAFFLVRSGGAIVSRDQQGVQQEV